MENKTYYVNEKEWEDAYGVSMEELLEGLFED